MEDLGLGYIVQEDLHSLIQYNGAVKPKGHSHVVQKHVYSLIQQNSAIKPKD